MRAAPPLVALAVTPRGGATLDPDSHGYIRLARSLADLEGFSNRGRPELARTPGYPLLLVPGVLVGRLELVAIALQIALGCLTVYLVLRTAMIALENLPGAPPGSGGAWAAAYLYACEPLSALYASKLLSETLFTALLAGFGLLLARYLRGLGWRDLLAAAIALAGAIYVRPIGYFLPGVVAVMLAIVAWRDASGRRLRWLQAVVFFAAAMMPVGAWQVRNLVQAGYPRFAAISDINLYFYQAAAVLARQQQRPLALVQHELGYTSDAAYFRKHPEQRGWSEARRLAFLRSEALRILRGDPAASLATHWAGIRGTLLDVGTSAYVHFFDMEKPVPPRPVERPEGLWPRVRRLAAARPVELALHLVLRMVLWGYLGLALVGLLFGRALKSETVVVLCAVALCLLVLSGGPVGYHRFRLPIVPVIALLAGQGLCWLRWSTLRKTKRALKGRPKAV